MTFSFHFRHFEKKYPFEIVFSLFYDKHFYGKNSHLIIKQTHINGMDIFPISIKNETGAIFWILNS